MEREERSLFLIGFPRKEDDPIRIRSIADMDEGQRKVKAAIKTGRFRSVGIGHIFVIHHADKPN